MHRVELGITPTLLSNNDNSDTTSIKVTGSKKTDATDTTGTKVDSMSRTLT
jgi:hypothetical protein